MRLPFPFPSRTRTHTHIHTYKPTVSSKSVRHAFLAGLRGQATCSNGDSDNYMDAVFEFLVQKEAEIWTSLLHRLSSKAYYSSQVSRVCVAIL